MTRSQERTQYWYHSIRFRIPAILTLVILIPVIAFWAYSYTTARQTTKNLAENAMQMNLESSALMLGERLSQVAELSRNICGDSDLLELVTHFIERGQAEDKAAVLLALGQYAAEYEGVADIVLLGEQLPLYLTTNLTEREIAPDSGLGEHLAGAFGELSEQIGWYTVPSPGDDGLSLGFARPLALGAQYSSVSLICTVEAELWRDCLQQAEDTAILVSSYGGEALLHSVNGPTSGDISTDPALVEAFSSNDDAGVYTTSGAAGDYLIGYHHALESGWKFIGMISLDVVFSGGPGIGPALALLALLGTVSASLGFLLMYLVIERPIRRLMHQMERMEQGDLEEISPIMQRDEMGLLLRRYNRMVVRLQELIDESYVQQLLRKMAELAALQSQMDEHFLYNTLNTIYCQAQQESAHVAAEMLLTLSRYFRLSLAQGKEKVGLDHIAELIDYYLRIACMRYGARLEVKLDTFPDMQAYQALKHLFQPIVENAIIHGLEGKSGVHCLTAAFAQEGDCLRFQVTDDGVGMTEQQIQEIMGEAGTFTKRGGKGYALRNIQEQIRIAYGDGYGIAILSKPGEGTTVVLTIPLERREDSES